MLFRQADLEGIVTGRVTLAYRRWERPRVRPGSRLRTPVGVLEVVSVERVAASAIDAESARRAGAASKAELLRLMAGRPGRIHRMELRYAGPDERIALRADDALGPVAVEEIARRLERLDAASPRGPWTRQVLELIAARPAVRAPDLAASLGRDKPSFKRDVRKLKELGLTESLEIGYRLSPRGEAFLGATR